MICTQFYDFKYFYAILIIFTSISSIDGTLLQITTLGQSGPGSNSNEWKITHSQELQKWSLTTGYSGGYWIKLECCSIKLAGKSLVSSFNGTSTFVGYLMLNPSFKKNRSGTI